LLQKKKVFGTSLYAEDSLISKKVFAANYSLSGRSKEDLKEKIALGLPVWLGTMRILSFF